MENGLLREITRLLESDENAISPEVANRLILASLVSYDRRLKEIEKLMPAVRVLMWVGAGIGVSMIALIWALITGQAQVVFS